MIPHLCHVFSTFATGGPEVRTVQIINATFGQFRHSIVSISGDLTARARLDPLAEVACLPAPAKRGKLQFPWVLGKQLRALGPDLVLTYGWGGVDAILAARLGGFRRIVHAEDGFLPDEAHGQKRSRLWARRVLLRWALRVVVPSRNLLGIAEKQWKLGAKLIRYIPNGIDTERFRPPGSGERQAARDQLGCRAGEVVVGTVGQLRAEKNHERLIRVFARAAQDMAARLFIVGEGPLRPRLEQVCRDLGVTDRVMLPGVRPDPIDYYRAMDVFALSSDTEQMPLSVLEAMGCGLPVASTAVGDVAVMVCEQNKPLISCPGEDEALATVLRTLVRDAATRDRLGTLNRQRCEDQFSLSRMISSYRSLYEEALLPSQEAA